MTVAQWMETWLTTIAPRRIRRSTLESTYVPKVCNRIIPGLGKHRLDRLTPEHIERFYTRLEAEGLAPATVIQIHRILSRALKVALQRGYVARNVATLVDAPCASYDEIEPLTFDEALRIVKLAATRRNGTRWSVALALGLRQGEALGLRWQHVDLDVGILMVRWQLQRFGWRHGCPDPHGCGKDRHSDGCPPGCMRHARSCPQRTGGGLQLTELKSDKSRRTIALPPQLAAALKAHRTAQLQARMVAGSAWHDGDFVWCQTNGRPVGASADWDEWQALLKTAGIRQVRVHDARHTAATLLLAQGVDQRCNGDPRPLTDQHDLQVRPRAARGHDRRGGQNRPGRCGATREPNCNPNCNPAERFLLRADKDAGQRWGVRGSNPEPTD